MTKISIVIVNWNTEDLLRECLQSLWDLPDQDLLNKIVVVDNASRDDSLKNTRDAFSDWDKTEFIESSENLGFAAASNIGLAKFAETDDHALLLNPDTRVTSGMLKGLASALDQHKNVGIVGPLFRNLDGSLQPSVRTFPTFFVMLFLFLKLLSLSERMGFLRSYFIRDFNFYREQVVDQVMGACFLIRNTTLRDVGLLDDGFWIWFEEVDYCKRALRKNWRTMFVPSAEIFHHGGASFSQLVGFRKSWPLLMSALRYSRKHLGILPTLTLWLLLPVALAVTIPASFLHVVIRRRRSI